MVYLNVDEKTVDAEFYVQWNYFLIEETWRYSLIYQHGKNSFPGELPSNEYWKNNSSWKEMTQDSNSN